MHTDRHIDRPTDRCKAICPPFSKGGIIILRLPKTVSTINNPVVIIDVAANADLTPIKLNLNV